ncbi:hypothetical protein LTR02_009661 [Friedmanniomyces endolithicus]|nr:hypothetical protein LTR03_008242 [Friedmanniomyces endolithicus]KAK0871472.1 hypothetical protein LTS02_001810 [Friedmanniomyces endolithicus]KAK0883906.1 hypothetical protein LTR87_002384 [Friedmanniomyces endolithicus]KAK0899509.1 hypothetical protein LTR02_009661 [Friedmanniomyces endolithicus]
MRLVNTTTLELVEHLNPPSYAILSHRWGDKEVSFKDYCLVRKDAQYTDQQRVERPWLEERAELSREIRARPGFTKIVDFCAIAKEGGESWAWIDTCCIDKRSSSELSESINSLSDVPFANTRDDHWWTVFSKSEWFLRGWTLQELLAPCRLVFYDQQWSEISAFVKNVSIRRHEVSFVERLASITRIPRDILFFTGGLHSHSVAARMSWAARRSLTREEDVAYCLLGVFNINMPLLYGEGAMAFVRLQREIIAQTYDQSILTWSTTCQYDSCETQTGPLCSSTGNLAPHPMYFQHCGDVNRSYSRYLNHRKNLETRHSVTNKGLELSVMAARIASRVTLYGMHGQFDIHLLRLQCWRSRGPSLPCTVALACDASPSNHIGPLRAAFRALTCDFLSDLSKCSPADLLRYGEKLRVHTADGNVEMLGSFSWKLTQFYIALV